LFENGDIIDSLEEWFSSNQPEVDEWCRFKRTAFKWLA